MKKFFCLIFVLICFLSGCQNHYSCTQAIKERFPDSEIEVLSGQPIEGWSIFKVNSLILFCSLQNLDIYIKESTFHKTIINNRMHKKTTNICRRSLVK